MMKVRYKGSVSSQFTLPGGAPQGTLLGVLFYLVYINKAAWPDNTSQKPPPSITSNYVRLKYIDDLTKGVAVNLKTLLCTSLDRSGPKNFHDRNGLTLPSVNSKLQYDIDNLNTFSKNHSMKINENKSKIMPINFTKKFDFVPKITVGEMNNMLEVVYETKLLGVILTSDGKWSANTKYIVKKATGKLWFLRRLRSHGADKNILLEAYQLHIRSILELAVPLWHSSLSDSDSCKIERVQKMAFAIILKRKYSSYDTARQNLNMTTLKERRDILCKRFAMNLYKDPKHKEIFQTIDPNRPNTRNKQVLKEFTCRTERFYKSAVPHMTRLINKYIVS